MEISLGLRKPASTYGWLVVRRWLHDDGRVASLGPVGLQGVVRGYNMNNDIGLNSPTERGLRVRHVQF